MLVFSLNKLQHVLPQKAKKTRTPFHAPDRQKLAAGTMSGAVALNTLTLPQSVMRLSISSVPSCGKKRRFNCRSPCQLDSLFVRNCIERFMLLLSLWSCLRTLFMLDKQQDLNSSGLVWMQSLQVFLTRSWFKLVFNDAAALKLLIYYW